MSACNQWLPMLLAIYLDGLGDHWKDVKTKGLRAIPIEKTIDDPRCVLPYEAVLKVLQAQDRVCGGHMRLQASKKQRP